MTGERTPIKKVWLERASSGFLRVGSICPKTGKSHKLADNTEENGTVRFCSTCRAGIHPKNQREQTAKDIITHESELRVSCWMCGDSFSRPRTKDEYLHQMCAKCLTACEAAGILRLQDPRTREAGKAPPSQSSKTTV